MKSIAVGGTIVVDEVNTIQKYPAKGMLAKILSVKKRPGGAVPNVLADLRRIDANLPLSAIGLIGSDSNGAYINDFLAAKNIDVSRLKITEKDKTGFTDAMVEENGERTFFTYSGTNDLLDIEDIDVDNLNCSIFHVGYLLLLKNLDEEVNGSTRMASLLKKVQERGIKTSIDAVSDSNPRFPQIVLPSLKYSNYVIFNEIEGGLTAGIKPRKSDGSLDIDAIRRICLKLIDGGVKDLAVLHCPEGSFSMDYKRNFSKLGSAILPDKYIKGTVGAGDAFCAGCLYGLLNGMKGTDLLSFASGTATMSLSDESPSEGIGGFKEIDAISSRFSRRIL